tara:strand:+ start:19762 stop:19947 length:186 start_codon:yes stop_codon:yes gene_type:complete
MTNAVEKALEEVRKRSKERLEICGNCEHLRESINQCKICGCYLPLKVLMPTQRCPLDPPKW